MIRQLATEGGGKYQTVLNQILKKALFGESEGLVGRIDRLEKAVFKKQAA